MKKFFIGLLKAIGYFGIYLGMQLLVSIVYSVGVMVPVVMKYSFGEYDLTDPVVFDQYMNDITNPILEATMAITVISGILTLGVLWLIFACRKKKFTKEVGLQKVSLGTLPSIVLMGLGFNVLTGVALSFLPESWLGSYEEAASAGFMGSDWVTFVGTVIMAPIVEEVIFRGLAYGRMKKGMPVVLAAVLSSALFAVAHGHPVWMLYTFVFGMILVWVFERTRSLLASIVLHLSYNLCAMLQLFLPEDVSDIIGILLFVLALFFAVAGVFWFVKIPQIPAPEDEPTEQ